MDIKRITDLDSVNIGTKIKYVGAQEHFWYTDIIQNAKDNLKIGNVYTIKTIDIYSSWCTITLEEAGDEEYSLSFFTEI